MYRQVIRAILLAFIAAAPLGAAVPESLLLSRSLPVDALSEGSHSWCPGGVIEAVRFDWSGQGVAELEWRRRDPRRWGAWRPVAAGVWQEFVERVLEVELRGRGNFEVTAIRMDLACTLVEKPCKTPETVDVLERDEWGARPPQGEYQDHEPVAVVLHHSWRPTVEQYREYSTIAGIQRYHMFSPYTGWDDIGYHFLIGPDGLVYRGRPADVVGAHCVPNHGKVGICVIGNFDEDGDELSASALAQLRRLVLELAGEYDIPPDRVFGHRDFSSKSCPGQIVYEHLPGIRRDVRRILGFVGQWDHHE